jgi:hypothetical protein
MLLRLRLFGWRNERLGFYAVSFGSRRAIAFPMLGKVALAAAIDDLRVARARRFFGRPARLPETNRISGIEAGKRKPRRDRYGSRVRKSKSLLIHGAEGRSKSRLVRPLGGGHLTAREPYRILLADIAWQQQECKDTEAKGSRKAALWLPK